MPQHAIPGGNQDPNGEDNVNVDPNQPNPPDDQQNPAPQPDLHQQQGNAGQYQPPQPNQQQQAPDPDATQEAMNRLMGMCEDIYMKCTGRYTLEGARTHKS